MTTSVHRVDRSALQEALQLAVLAPSAHNTQPWRVTVSGDRVELSVDPSRTLPHSDPASRDLHLAMGAFAEALAIGLCSVGARAATIDAGPGAWAAFRLSAGDVAGREEASLLRRRQTSRIAYSPRPLETATLGKLAQAARAHGLELHLVPRGADGHAALREQLAAASRESWLDTRAVKELGAWVHADVEGLHTPAEGLSTHCLALGIPQSLALMVALRPALWRGLHRVYAAPFLAERLAAEDVRSFEQSAAVALLIAPGVDGRSGGAMLRFWLELTRLGIAAHPLSVLLDRRGWEVGRMVGVDPRRIRMALRLGKSAPPPRSGRRPVERFATFE